MTISLDPPAREHTCVMATGGMDSTVLLWWLASHDVPVTPVFVDYGHHSAQTERATLASVVPPRLAENIQAVDVARLYEGLPSAALIPRDLWTEPIDSDDLHLPARNLILIAVGAATAERVGARRLNLAFILSNVTESGDRSRAFLEHARLVVETAGGITVGYPFLELTKAEVARLGLQLGAPIAKTFSCQVAPRTPCGACPNCQDRIDALSEVEHAHEHERIRPDEGHERMS